MRFLNYRIVFLAKIRTMRILPDLQYNDIYYNCFLNKMCANHDFYLFLSVHQWNIEVILPERHFRRPQRQGRQVNRKPQTWTSSVKCLSNCESLTIPSKISEKQALLRSGLGQKRIQFILEMTEDEFAR